MTKAQTVVSLVSTIVVLESTHRPRVAVKRISFIDKHLTPTSIEIAC